MLMRTPTTTTVKIPLADSDLVTEARRIGDLLLPSERTAVHAAMRTSDMADVVAIAETTSCRLCAIPPELRAPWVAWPSCDVHEATA